MNSDVQQNMQVAEAFRYLRLQGTTNLQVPFKAAHFIFSFAFAVSRRESMQVNPNAHIK